MDAYFTRQVVLLAIVSGNFCHFMIVCGNFTALIQIKLTFLQCIFITKLYLQGLATLVTIWYNETHVASENLVEDLGNCSTHELNITGLPEDAEISLQTDLDGIFFSKHSDKVPIFPRTSSILFGRDNTLWIIIGTCDKQI